MIPKRHDPITETIPLDHVRQQLHQMKAMIRQGVERIPTHDGFIAANCKAPPLR
jgi:tryptophan halogenase